MDINGTEATLISNLHIEDVYKSYGKNVILDDIDLTVEDGEFVTVVGPSGCGKSTLLKLIIGQEKATSGIITLNDEPIGMPCSQRGVVYQNYSLFPHLTVLENVMLGKKLQSGWVKWQKNKAQVKEQALEYLNRVGLGDHLDKFPKQLSGGQQQRVAITQALMQQPEILCMDEPFSALDPGTRENLQLFLLELWEDTGMTIFFVTHDLEEAVYLGTRLIALSQYYTDDRSVTEERRGAKIVCDMQLHDKKVAFSPEVKRTLEFNERIASIRQQAFDPEYRQHVNAFTLTHPSSWRTLQDNK